jgi:hypothetical protein
MVVKIAGTHWRPLSSNQTQAKMARHDIICLHTMVGYLTSTETMFKKDGYTGVESHFGVGGIWGSDKGHDLDGVVYQWQDLTYRADANLDGNHRLISIETADNAPRSAADIEPWTAKQCTAIIKLVAALCRRYDIPAKLVPDSKSTRRGIGYHRQGINPWRVSGGELWSSAQGKECPGDRRIAQLRSVIIPGVQRVLAGKPIEEDDGVAWSDQHKLTESDAKIYGEKEGSLRPEGAFIRYPPGVERLRQEMKAANKTMTALIGAQNGAIAALTAALQGGTSLSAEQAQAAARAGAEEALTALSEPVVADDEDLVADGDDVVSA